MPQFTCITLQPLFEACLELEVIITVKAKISFYKKMIQLQNFLLLCHMGAPYHTFKGLEIIQETFYYQEKLAGFLKARINMNHCSLTREQIIELYDYGMIDSIIFTRPEEVLYFGEKLQSFIGNITVWEMVQAQFYWIPPKIYGLTEEPTKHEIFVVPIREARHPVAPPRDFTYIDDMEFYLFLETKERRKYEPAWFNFNLMAEGRTWTLQIWAPSNWKIWIPFSSQGRRLSHEDIIEGDPGHRNPTTIPIIDYDLTTSEGDDDQVYEDEENEIIDEDIPDTHWDFWKKKVFCRLASTEEIRFEVWIFVTNGCVHNINSIIFYFEVQVYIRTSYVSTQSKSSREEEWKNWSVEGKVEFLSSRFKCLSIWVSDCLSGWVFECL